MARRTGICIKPASFWARRIRGDEDPNYDEFGSAWRRPNARAQAIRWHSIPGGTASTTTTARASSTGAGAIGFHLDSLSFTTARRDKLVGQRPIERNHRDQCAVGEPYLEGLPRPAAFIATSWKAPTLAMHFCATRDGSSDDRDIGDPLYRAFPAEARRRSILPATLFVRYREPRRRRGAFHHRHRNAGRAAPQGAPASRYPPAGAIDDSIPRQRHRGPRELVARASQLPRNP